MIIDRKLIDAINQLEELANWKICKIDYDEVYTGHGHEYKTVAVITLEEKGDDKNEHSNHTKANVKD